MSRRHFFRILALCLGSITVISSLGAQGAAERIRARLSEIDALKAAGMIGETREGLVAARALVNEEQQELVDAENRDRQELYQIVARRSGVSLEEVGRQRAAKIARQAKRGVWLQDSRGEWYRKGSERGG